MKKKERLSNFELLRIIGMFLILISHFNMHGDFGGIISKYKINNIFVYLFVFGTIANHIFILLTGYFMAGSKVNFKKIIILIMQMVFYSICIPIFLYCLGFIDLKKIDIIKMIFPIFFGNWFCIYYILLFCFIPVINKLIEYIDRKFFERLILILIIVFCIIPMVTSNIWGFSNLGLFIMDYIIGAYIKVYGTTKKQLFI